MIGIEIGLFLVPLIVVVLGLILALRARQAREAARADLAAFARARGLTGSIEDPFSLSGGFDGLPCYITTDRAGEGKAQRSILRVRLLTTDAAAYRDAPGATPTALVLAREEAVPADRVTGLHEIPSGDPVFDAAYRAFIAPGGDPPWRNRALRGALVSLRGLLSRAERGPAECSVALGVYHARGALFGRAMTIAGALAGPENLRRHEQELAAPFDARTPVEQVRVGWALGRWLTVSIGGFVAAFPLAFVPPIHDLIEYVACEPGDLLKTVGVGNGRGANYACIGEHGRYGANGWLVLVGADAGLVVMLILFSLFELVVRRRGRDAA